MLRTIADLLQTLIDTERTALDESDIRHPGTIGEMYEGLTRSTLEKAIPSPLNAELRVTHGFIRHSDGNLSAEIDCLLARGEGTQVPHTDRRIYQLSDVLAVIEIKKNLYSNELRSAHENLLTVSRCPAIGSVNERLVRAAFQGITGHPMPETVEETLDLPLHIRHIYYSTMWDAFLPPRIVFGYNGFSTENALRNSFLAYLETRQGTSFCNPAGLPSLITCNGSSIYKMNGMPDHVAMNDGKWPLFASSNRNPIYLLLDQIFCRLNYAGEIPPSFFGQELDTQSGNILALASFEERKEILAWHLDVFGEVEDYGRIEDHDTPWEPQQITECECVVLNMIDAEGVTLDDEEFIRFVKEHGETVESIVTSLESKRLAAPKGNALEFLTAGCVTAILPDGRFIAGDNVAGKMSAYLNAKLSTRG
jgi:hypothetical protein